jgi:hypothetical protein
VADILDRQRALARSPTKDAPAGEAAARQGELRSEAEKVAKQLESLAPPEKAGTPEAGAARAAAGKVTDAASGMRRAEELLRAGESAQARRAQDGAEKDLEHALKALEEQIGPDQPSPPTEQAGRQRQTAAQTRQLSGAMKPGQGSTPGSQSPGSQAPPPAEGEPPADDAEPVPGQQDVEGAVPLQEQAAGDLERNNPGAAVGRQKEALKKLEAAREQLEATLEQARKEQQQELLAALETRFRAMLERQVAIDKATRRLAGIGRDRWQRADQLELAELAQGQSHVATEADKALFILTEEGTTVVFPEIVRQVRDDANDVAGRLNTADTTPAVLAMQEGIEQALRELIDAIEKKQEENDSSGGAGENQATAGTPPLLPGSAELKLLRSCQLRVNQATQAIQRERQAGTEDAAQAQRVGRLAERQRQVSEMARTMHESLTRAQ